MPDESKELGMDEAPLAISPERVCFIIVKALELKLHPMAYRYG